MSIRTNKMKAVAVLMKQLTTSRRKFHERGRDESFDGELEKLRLVLNNIKDVFVEVKKNEENLLDTLAEVYDYLHRLDHKKLHQGMKDICNRIKCSARNLLPKLDFDESKKEEIFHSSKELLQPRETSWSLRDFASSEGYLYSLLVFPKNAVIRKRNAINLWIGEGLLKNTGNKTTEELGNDVIRTLLKFNLIVSYGNGKCPLVNKFQIVPSIRNQMEGGFSIINVDHPGNKLAAGFSERNVDHRGQYFIPNLDFEGTTERLTLERKKVTLGGGDWYFSDRPLCTVFNISASYLNFRPQWVTELKNLEVLQLGRWQDSPLHHIEVGSEELLKELRYLQKLKYLSLRGISRIFELPSSIVELESLLILDLKACHNLERLPNDISLMTNLTHLIMSDCCLLESMPKGIEKLTNLQVLKGFLITTSEKTPCKISDLVNNLRKLKRLSIRIGSEAVIKDGEFQSLASFSALEHLKISWSVFDPRYANISIHLPTDLRKLHLECFPGKSLPPSLERSMTRPREINITGGKLESIDPNIILLYKVEILRLKYLEHLKVDIDNLKAFIPKLKYVEIRKIQNHSYIERAYEYDSD
ncbi:disease resistance RPP13-like protein 4 [Vigna radiata var. radiata]|uniref:Disease resistance RPP13-like protein 4 n=1 Tax=Vigna radiata var. radiata TaxID=3916 RepID=A0A1S3UZV9_VIGRR|nr:disease resistance RPP13-like protein 4 [Vigna radiata var. radiata]